MTAASAERVKPDIWFFFEEFQGKFIARNVFLPMLYLDIIKLSLI